jgi:hypothetical protein
MHMTSGQYYAASVELNNLDHRNKKCLIQVYAKTRARKCRLRILDRILPLGLQVDLAPSMDGISLEITYDL